MKRDVIEMQYLLGKLSESEAERFEERYFADDSLFDEIELAEDDLIDAYVRNQLSAADRKRFETKLVSSKRIADRVEFAKLFVNSAPVSPVVIEPAKPGWWANLFRYSWVPNSAFSGAVAGILLLLVLGIPGSIAWLKLRNESRRLDIERAALAQQKQELERQWEQKFAKQQSETNALDSQLKTATDEQTKLQQQLEAMKEQLARQNQPTTVPVPASASFLIFSSFSSRGSGQIKELSVPPAAKSLQLQLVLDANDYKSYTATLQSSANANICSEENLKPRRSGKRWIIELRCDSQDVSSGLYLVRVNGRRPTGTLEDIADYRFRVAKN